MDTRALKGSPKRVFIVDDHPVVRAGLRQFLAVQEDLRVCGEAGSAEEALTMIPETRPDLIITDLALPGKSGLDLIRELAANGSDEIATMVVSLHEETSHALPAIKAGARGYVMKEAAGMLLIQAVSKVLDGEIFLSPAITEHVETLLEEGKRRRSRFPIEALSGTAREVIRLIGQGKSTARIAELLKLSEVAVEEHLSRVQHQFALENRGNLVREAVCWVAVEPAYDLDFLSGLIDQNPHGATQLSRSSFTPTPSTC